MTFRFLNLAKKGKKLHYHRAPDINKHRPWEGGF